MSLLRWLFMLPVILLVIVFALANPAPTEILWSPFSQPVTLPLYFIVVFFLCIGFLIGAIIAWVGMYPGWKEKRDLKKQNAQLQKEINTANEKLIEELSKEKPDPYTRLPDAS